MPIRVSPQILTCLLQAWRIQEQEFSIFRSLRTQCHGIHAQERKLRQVDPLCSTIVMNTRNFKTLQLLQLCERQHEIVVDGVRDLQFLQGLQHGATFDKVRTGHQTETVVDQIERASPSVVRQPEQIRTDQQLGDFKFKVDEIPESS